MNYIEQINLNEYMYLENLYEEDENDLSIIISIARVEDEVSEKIEGVEFIGKPIVADENSDKYKFVFENYISYCVTNESYTSWDDYEVFEGKLIRKYEKSRFLDCLPSLVIIELVNEIVGKPVHYGICCLNHVIDVASSGEPKIIKL